MRRGPLHTAAAKGLVEVVRFVIGQRANVSAADNEGFTPLQRAAAFAVDAVRRCLRLEPPGRAAAAGLAVPLGSRPLRAVPPAEVAARARPARARVAPPALHGRLAHAELRLRQLVLEELQRLKGCECRASVLFVSPIAAAAVQRTLPSRPR